MSRDLDSLPDYAESASEALARIDEKVKAAKDKGQSETERSLAKPFHNFDGSPLRIWQLSSIASGAGCKQFEQLESGRVSCKYWYVQELEFEREATGEITRTPRIVFIDENDNGVSFSSHGMMQALETIREIFGDGPYDPPKQFDVKSVRTRKGNRTYAITPVE